MENRSQPNLELAEREKLQMIRQSWDSVSKLQHMAFNGFRELKPLLEELKDAEAGPTFDIEARPYIHKALRLAIDNERFYLREQELLDRWLRGHHKKQSLTDPRMAVDPDGKNPVPIPSCYFIGLENLVQELKRNFAIACDISKANMQKVLENRLNQTGSRPVFPQTQTPPLEVRINAPDQD